MKQPAAINGMMSSQKLRPQLFAIFVFSVCCLLILSVYHSVATRYGLSGISFSTARCGESRIPIKFETQHQYMNMSAEYDHLWDELLTPTGGFIDNGDGVEGTHGLSMFHQLHCLQMIRNAFQDLQRSERKKKGHHGHGQSKDDDELHPHELHWTHCLDYLRQNILCTADATIEPSRWSTKGELIVDGNVVHQCRDAKSLYSVAGGVR